jgi:hypothetical protein
MNLQRLLRAPFCVAHTVTLKRIHRMGNKKKRWREYNAQPLEGEHPNFKIDVELYPSQPYVQKVLTISVSP